MNVEIMIVSFRNDFKYLKYALRSVAKFCNGFFGCTLVVPQADLSALNPLKHEWKGLFPLRIKDFTEWYGKGFLHHEFIVISADEYCPNAEVVFHLDSDEVFLEHVTPETFFREGKPIMAYARYDWLIANHNPLIKCWKEDAENALGWTVEYEYMRHPQLIYWRELYPKTRQCIHEHTNRKVDSYIKDQREEFPQGFAEHPTLGAVAWRFFRDKYFWINQETEEMPKRVVYQAWSRRDPTEEDMSKYCSLGLA